MSRYVPCFMKALAFVIKPIAKGKGVTPVLLSDSTNSPRTP